MKLGALLEWWRQRRARAQAAVWLTRMSRGLTPGRQRALEHWLTSPINAKEFSELRSILDVAAELRGPMRAALIAAVPQGVHRVPVGRGTRWLAATSAAAMVAAASAGGLWLWNGGYLPRTYQTGIGQMHSVVLPDGSVAYLNTNTKLRWVGSPDDRRVQLLRGEAFFEVVHDPTRPFRILLAHSEVEVLGTRFDVYRKRNGEVLVTVLSGTVSVQGLGAGAGSRPSWMRRLTANEQIEYSSVGLIADVHAASALEAIRWRQGIIATRGEPLSKFVSNLSRYTSQRIVISDPRAAQMQIGGAFSVRNVYATLERIARIEPITVTQQGGQLILGYRSDPQQPRGVPR